MNQLNFLKDYYKRWDRNTKKNFRRYMFEQLDISDTGLYRRMRLGCFKKVEWNFVIDYVNKYCK